MIQYNKDKDNSWKYIMETFKFLEKKKFIFFIGMIGISLGYSGMSMLAAFLLKYMIDLGENIQKLQGSIYILYSILGIIFLVIVSGAFQSMYEISGRYAVAVIRKKVNEKRKKLTYSYFDKNQNGDILTKIIYDIDKVNENLTNNIKNVITPILSFIFTLVPMLIISFELTLILFIITVIFLIFNIMYKKHTKKIGFELSMGMQVISNKISDLLRGRLTIKVNGMEEEYSRKFQSVNIDYTQVVKKQNIIYTKLESANVVFTLVSSLVFIAVGSIYVSLNKTTYGTLVSLIALQEGLTYGCLTASRKIPVVFENLASTKRICDFLKLSESSEKIICENTDKGIIQLKNVNFGYDSENQILKDINMIIEENSCAIIRGSSGSGKSSLIKLLLGFYSPREGSIMMEHPSKLIAYVPQVPFLYNDTIRNNILYGKPDATEKEYEQAVKLAYADEVIQKLLDKDETVIESGGKNLSRGQCQRIALARGLIKDAPVLLLDEITASLDSISKRYIESILEKLKSNKTIIMITHDDISIKDGDIYYMNDGIVSKVN